MCAGLTETGIMPPTVLTAAQEKMLDFLIERARRSPGQTITYGELARALDPDFNPRDRHHVRLHPQSLQRQLLLLRAGHAPVRVPWSARKRPPAG